MMICRAASPRTRRRPRPGGLGGGSREAAELVEGHVQHDLGGLAGALRQAPGADQPTAGLIRQLHRDPRHIGPRATSATYRQSRPEPRTCKVTSLKAEGRRFDPPLTNQTSTSLTWANVRYRLSRLARIRAACR